MSSNRVYLDYNATTPIRPEAASLMNEIMASPGNASSIHGFGRQARAVMERARMQVAALCGTQAPHVIFTSGATEANNAVLQAFRGERVLISAIEHPSVMEAAPNAEKIPVTPDGVVDVAAFEKMLVQGNPPTLISIMAANNETGAIQPIETLAKLARKKIPSVHFHTDAVQAAGKIPLEFPALHADYLSLSAHKIGGSQGVGALVAAPGARPAKLLHGGGQERRQRAGTENVAGIAGFGLAAEMALADIKNFQTLSKLRDRLENDLKKIAPDLIVFAQNAPRIANTSCFSLPGTAAQTLLMALDLEGIAVSSGSACSSGAIKPSYVLQAMGKTPMETAGALRLSMGWNTSRADIDRFTAAWSVVVPRLMKGEKVHV